MAKKKKPKEEIIQLINGPLDGLFIQAEQYEEKVSIEKFPPNLLLQDDKGGHFLYIKSAENPYKFFYQGHKKDPLLPPPAI